MATYEIGGLGSTKMGTNGALLGDTTASLVGFFGATPVVRQTKSVAFAAGDSTVTMGAALTAIQLAMTNLGLTN